MTDHNSQLQALHEKLTRKGKLTSMLDHLDAQLADLQREEQRLAQIRSAEQKDVDKLERLSLSSVFYSILSRKEEKLDKERAEAYAAALKHDAALRQVEKAEREIAALEAELQTLSGVEQEYAAALSAKAEALKASNAACGAKLLDMEDRLAAIAAEDKELDEALDAGDDVLSKLSSIEQALAGAEGWGTWDLFGGGLISDAIKYSHIDNAQNQMNDLQSDLRHYQAELADVAVQADIQLQVEGFLRFADYFFDDIFSSLAVLDRIHNSQSELYNIRTQVNTVQQQLEQRKAALQQEAAQLKAAWDTLINQA